LNYSFKYELNFKKAEIFAKKNLLGIWKKQNLYKKNDFKKEEIKLDIKEKIISQEANIKNEKDYKLENNT